MTLKPDTPSEPTREDWEAARRVVTAWEVAEEESLRNGHRHTFERLIAQDRASLRADLQREREQAVRQALEGVADLMCYWCATDKPLDDERRHLVDGDWRGCYVPAPLANAIVELSAALGVQPATPEGKP